MCCTTTHLGKGARCAPPLHPPGRGSVRALNPFLSQKIVSPINHSQGLETSLSTCTEPWIMGAIVPTLEPHSRETSLSLHPSTWRAFLPPRPQTTSWRRLLRDRGREYSRCPYLGTFPSTIEPSCPLEPRPTLRGLDAAILSKMDHDHRKYHTFEGSTAVTIALTRNYLNLPEKSFHSTARCGKSSVSMASETGGSAPLILIDPIKKRGEQ